MEQKKLYITSINELVQTGHVLNSQRVTGHLGQFTIVPLYKKTLDSYLLLLLGFWTKLTE